MSNLDAAFSGIAEELRRQYSLGYYPENVGQAGERRRIQRPGREAEFRGQGEIELYRRSNQPESGGEQSGN